MTIVVLQLKQASMNRYLFAGSQPRWGIPKLQLQQLLRCNDLWSPGVVALMTTPNRFPSWGLSLAACFFLLLPANKADSHCTRRSTPTSTFVSQTTTGSSSILFFRIIYVCVCVYLKVNYTTGTIYFRGFLVAFHFCLKGTFLFTLCIIACFNPLHFT